MRCIYCNDENGTRKHESFCPYNPLNIRKIGIYLRDFAENESMFNKNFKPFPHPKVFDKFLAHNKIMRLKTIRRRYFEPGLRLEDWLSEIISIGLENGNLKEEEFPIYILYLWDSFLFRTKEQYFSDYKLAIEYEDSVNRNNRENLKPFVVERV